MASKGKIKAKAPSSVPGGDPVVVSSVPAPKAKANGPLLRAKRTKAKDSGEEQQAKRAKAAAKRVLKRNNTADDYKLAEQMVGERFRNLDEKERKGYVDIIAADLKTTRGKEIKGRVEYGYYEEVQGRYIISENGLNRIFLFVLCFHQSLSHC